MAARERPSSSRKTPGPKRAAAGRPAGTEKKDEFLSPNMVGRELGITGEAVKQWIYRRKLPATKLPNGYWRVARADLERYLRERKEGARRRLLLVGDTACGMAEGVERAGWRALVAGNPIDAVLRATDDRPSAVAIDVFSLGEGGWRAAEKLRTTRGTRSIPVLLLAPEGMEADADAMDRAIAVGARGYLCGSLTSEDLIRAVEGVLGGSVPN
jgi:hypothetical protein